MDNSDALVLTIGSIGKLICSNLRVGWVRAPEPIIQRLARLRPRWIWRPTSYSGHRHSFAGRRGEARNFTSRSA